MFQYNSFPQRFALIIGLVFIFFIKINAQTELKIGNNAGAMQSSAAFEVESSTKGILYPRMTTVQMNAIASPALGLMIYNTDLNCIHYYFGGWKSQCDPANLGAWSLLGNTGTNPAINFLGTTDAQDLVFRTNNTEKVRVTSGGSVGVGITVPTQKFELSNGNILLSNTGTAGELRLAEPSASGTHYSAFRAQAQAVDITYTLPANAGVTGQQLTTDGVGNLTWVNASAATTNTLSLSGNTLTSTVNGIAATSNAVSTVANTSAVNSLTTTVNGIAATPVTIINSNATSLSGSNLTTTVNGVASTALDLAPAVGLTAWKLLGNASTTQATNFLGTTDNVGLSFRTNNQIRATIANSGYVGIGTISPTVPFHVAGNPQDVPNGGAVLFESNLNSATNPQHAIQLFANVNPVSASNQTTTGINAQMFTSGLNMTNATVQAISGGLFNNSTGTIEKAIGVRAYNTNNTTGIVNNMYGFYAANPGNLSGTVNNNYALYLENQIGATNNYAIYSVGGKSYHAGNLGLGVTNPAYKLDINATSNPLRMSGLQVGSTLDSILTVSSAVVKRMRFSDMISGNAWSLTGNAGTTDGTNFIGTRDNIPFNIRVNNQKAGRIDNTNGTSFFGYLSGNANTATYNAGFGDYALSANTSGFANSAFGADAMKSNTTGYVNSAFGRDALKANTTGKQSAAFGAGALTFNTTGDNNNAFGYQALNQNTTGVGNNAFGYQNLVNNLTGIFNASYGHAALYSNTTGGYNTVLGSSAAFASTTASNNTVIGNEALRYNITGGNNVMIGHQAGHNNTASGNHFVGYQAGLTNTSGIENHFVGYQAGYSNTTGYLNHFSGFKAGYSNTTAAANTAVGYLAGNALTTGGSNVALGYAALKSNTVDGYNVAIGSSAMINSTTGSYNVAVGPSALAINQGSNNVGVGYQALGNNTTGNANVAIGLNAAGSNTTGSSNSVVGYGVLVNNTTGSSISAIGESALRFNTTGSLNNAFGYYSMYNNSTGSGNTSFGSYAMNSNSTGNDNVAIGNNAFYTANSSRNVGVGYYVGSRVTTGVENLFLGNEAGNYVTTGSRNVILGYQSGAQLITGNNNTLIGIGANVPSNGGAFTNATAIGYNAIVGASNSLVLGGTGADLVNVGIGNTTPSNTLHLTPSAGADPLRVENIRSGSTADSILTTTSTGLIKKITVTALSTRLGSNFWSMSGNAFTNPATNFAGTTDAQDFVFRTNNTEKMRITSGGNVGIGIAAPTAKFHIVDGALDLKASASTGFQVETTGGAAWTNLGTTSAAPILQWYNSANTGLGVITSVGRMGVGTTAPTSKVHIIGEDNLADTEISSTVANNATQGVAIKYSGIFKTGSNAASSLDINAKGTGNIIMHASSSGATTSTGNVGIGIAAPNTKIDIDGAVAIRSSATSVTADNQVITVGNRSYIKLTGDATPSSRTVTLSAGLSDGQILIISVIGTGTNGIELTDSGNLNLSGLMQLDNGDTIQLIWDGTSWNEITRSSN
jgi:hypothetical protein